jgi:hypothetical protein
LASIAASRRIKSIQRVAVGMLLITGAVNYGDAQQ